MREQEKAERIHKALDIFRIELPSWGFANTGTRFGKYLQPAAASSLEEKFADAGMVHQLTGASPLLALHVEWDLPGGVKDVPEVRALEKKHGLRAGSINPNLFQSQDYKFGSICNPDPAIRAKATNHLLLSFEIGKRLGSRDLSSKTTAIMVAPLRANLKEQGITDESLSVIFRGGQEATNLFQTLNRDQQMALTDFQETYTSISAAMTRMAEASRSSARTGLLLFIVIFLVGILIFRFRSIASPPLIPPAS